MTFPPAFERRSRGRLRRHAVAVGARLGVLLATAGAAVLEPAPTWTMFVVAVLAGAVSVARPDRVGALPPAVVLLVGWVVGYGTDTVAALPRTVGFALLLVVLHECATLAAAVPVSAYATTSVVRRWLLRLAPEAGAVAVAAGAVAGTGRLRGSLAVDIAGLAAVVVVLAGLGWLAHSTTRRG